MKCVRNTGMGIHFNTWSAICSRAQRNMRKTHGYDYEYLDMREPRYHLRRRTLLDLRKSENRELYWFTRARLLHRYNQNAWGCR